MQRASTAEESMQSRSSISTDKVSHSGGRGGGGHAPHLTIFFEPRPLTKTDAPHGAPPT